ncbi:protein FAR1-RELATED SEQUENCE 2-like [Silene latifolia]|uniref:protein FAR1-RELATED SEQUENCE 2-like n=1 Tax=Silene latifolia TaxID=37657 RepID=UPI003D76D772
MVTCFASRDEAFYGAQKIAFDNGFALVKALNGSKNRKQPELQGSYFRCSKYGRTRKKIDPDIPEKPKKKGTSKCECLFRVRAVENRANDINGKELIVWNILTSEEGGYHNHQVAKYKDGDRHFAGLDAEEKEFVTQQVRASIPPRDIKNDPETKELSHVFMAHPEAVKLFRANPHAVLIDSTYTTNVYKIALSEVVGVTPCGSSFLIVAVLLPSESENDYGWMLMRLGELLSCTGSSIPAFVTDREMSLIAAFEFLYPSTPHLLCAVSLAH